MKLGSLKDIEPWRAGGPPPPGSYTARIDDAGEGQSKNGYPQLTINWTVVGGDYDGAEITDWLTITEATRGKVVALLNATGVEITDGDFELNPADLKGRKAQIVCRAEPSYKDPSKTVTKVAGYKAAPDGGAPATNGNSSGDHEAPLPF